MYVCILKKHKSILVSREMAASLSATLSDLKEEKLKNKQIQQLLHSSGNGASSDMTSSPPPAASQMRRKRNHPGNPSKIDLCYVCVCV